MNINSLNGCQEFLYYKKFGVQLSHKSHQDLICHYDTLYRPNKSLPEPTADNVSHCGLYKNHNHAPLDAPLDAPRVCDHYKKEFCDPYELVYQGKYVIHKITYAVLLAQYNAQSKLIFHDIENKYWFFLCLDDVLTTGKHHSGINQV